MVENYSFYSTLNSGIALIGNTLKSIITNWFVFSPEVIFYNNPKLIVLGFSLFAFLGILIYQFFRIKARIGYFIEKKKETETLTKEYQLYILFLELPLLLLRLSMKFLR
ncbi:hypothetical protein ACQ9BO_21655 [Flavobacterium sp. P21]|uniref:hypothetical protein n=1 Tax=Flavobacterium sp. P21 TaxID=3423948 RepID=UPI003D669B08